LISIQLQCELNDEKERCRSLADKLEALESNLKESNETIDSFKIDLARHQSETERSEYTGIRNTRL
jgi:septal ring factor EnvC (AmiA/AmiB activator)